MLYHSNITQLYHYWYNSEMYPSNRCNPNNHHEILPVSIPMKKRITKMAVPINLDEEDYFSRPNKHPFNDLIGIISAKNGIGVQEFQKQ